MDIELTEKIEKMRAEGKLDTEQSVDLILRLLINLQQGQQDIMQVLVKREDEINSLDARLILNEARTELLAGLEPKVATMEAKLSSLESTMLVLAENIKLNSKTLERVDVESEVNSNLVHDLKRHSIVYWIRGHKILSIFTLGALLTLINYHTEVYNIIMMLLGFRVP